MTIIMQQNENATAFCKKLTDLCNEYKIQIKSGTCQDEGCLIIDEPDPIGKKMLYIPERNKHGDYIVRSYQEI